MLLNSVWVGFVLMVTWVLVVCMHGGRHNRGRTTWAFIRLRRQRKKSPQPFNKMRKSGSRLSRAAALQEKRSSDILDHVRFSFAAATALESRGPAAAAESA